MERAKKVRIVEYFSMFGYKHDVKTGSGVGQLVYRFPDLDWKDFPHPDPNSIEIMCQPKGWRLLNAAASPSFVPMVLTLLSGERYYTGIFTFWEPYSPHQDGSSVSTLEPLSTPLYAPKSLVIVSRFPQFDTIRCLLLLIYHALIESRPITQLVANLIIRTQVSAAWHVHKCVIDESEPAQLVCLLRNPRVPASNCSVLKLVRALGASQTLVLISALMNEQKVAFVSRSYARLNESCQAIDSLLYPFRFCFPLVPFVPAIYAGDLLSSPMPIVLGLHYATRSLLSDDGGQTAVTVDLDAGAVEVPEAIRSAVYALPESLSSRFLDTLLRLIDPLAFCDDRIFQRAPVEAQLHASLSDRGGAELLDKRIRALFVRLFAELVFGYRSCLVVVSVRPRFRFEFNRNAFLAHRGLRSDQFSVRFFSSMMFAEFLNERAAPFRAADIFDRIEVQLPAQLAAEQRQADDDVDVDTDGVSAHALLAHIDAIATELCSNEFCEPCAARIDVTRADYDAQVASLLQSRAHVSNEPLCLLDVNAINALISTSQSDHSGSCNGVNCSSVNEGEPTIIASGSHASRYVLGDLGASDALNERTIVAYERGNLRTSRIDVLRRCVAMLFDHKLLEARKFLPIALHVLRSSRDARFLLVAELNRHVVGISPHSAATTAKQARLDYSHFAVLMQLIDTVVRFESPADEYGIVGALLWPCAQLHCGVVADSSVTQFACTCLAEHGVFVSKQFWTTAIFRDLQSGLVRLYSSQSPKNERSFDQASFHSCVSDSDDEVQMQMQKLSKSTDEGSQLLSLVRNDPSALEFIGKLMKYEPNVAESDETAAAEREAQTLESQLYHYVHLIVRFALPADWRLIDVRRFDRSQQSAEADGDLGTDKESNSNSIAPFAPNSQQPAAESDSVSIMTRSMVQDDGEAQRKSVVSGLTQFLRDVFSDICSRVALSDASVNELLARLLTHAAAFLGVYLDELDEIRDCVATMPAAPKSIVPRLVLLPREQVLLPAVRCFLLAGALEQLYNAYPLSEHDQVGAKRGRRRPLLQALSQKSGGQSSSFVSSTLFQSNAPLNAYFPVEGALFVTNYRVIFKGWPADPLAADRIVSIGLTRAAVLRESRLKLRHFAHLVRHLQLSSGDQCASMKLRGADGTLLKIVFTNDAPLHQIHAIRRIVQAHSEPYAFAPALPIFCVTGAASTPGPVRRDRRDKSMTPKVSITHTLASKFTPPLWASRTARQRSIRAPASVDNFAGCFGEQVPARDSTLYAEANGTNLSSPVESVRELAPEFLEPLVELPDAKSIRKQFEKIFAEHASYADHRRFGLSVNAGKAHDAGSLRLTLVNEHYAVCSSYPAYLMVPKGWTDESLLRTASMYNQNRFPVVTYREASKQTLLLRSGSLNAKNAKLVVGKTRRDKLKDGNSTFHMPLSVTNDLDKLLDAIIVVTPGCCLAKKQGSDRISSFAFSLRSSVSTNVSGHGVGKKAKKVKELTANQRTVESVASSKLGDLPVKLAVIGEGEWASSKVFIEVMHRHNQSVFVRADCPKSTDMAKSLCGLLKACAPTRIAPAPRDATTLSDIDLQALAVAYADEWDDGGLPHPENMQRGAASKLKLNEDTEESFYSILEDCEWLLHVQTVLRLANCVADLLLAGVSVCVGLDDGGNQASTSAVISLAQLLIDAHYRTIDGFRSLIEKEWRSHAHFFAVKCNETDFGVGSKRASSSPGFLLFLDCVHQLVLQFPLSFEFTDLYLRCVAYHSLSQRFSTFLYDSEMRRFQNAQLAPTVPHQFAASVNASDVEQSYLNALQARKRSTGESGGSTIQRGGQRDEEVIRMSDPDFTNLWDYLDHARQAIPMLCNLRYVRSEDRFRYGLSDATLCAETHMARLELWDLFLERDLFDGAAVYDFDLRTHESVECRRQLNLPEEDCLSLPDVVLFHLLLLNCDVSGQVAQRPFSASTSTSSFGFNSLRKRKKKVSVISSADAVAASFPSSSVASAGSVVPQWRVGMARRVAVYGSFESTLFAALSGFNLLLMMLARCSQVYTLLGVGLGDSKRSSLGTSEDMLRSLFFRLCVGWPPALPVADESFNCGWRATLKNFSVSASDNSSVSALKDIESRTVDCNRGAVRFGSWRLSSDIIAQRRRVRRRSEADSQNDRIESNAMGSSADRHQFAKLSHFGTCVVCRENIVPLLSAASRCAHCSITVHEKCIPRIRINCNSRVQKASVGTGAACAAVSSSDVLAAATLSGTDSLHASDVCIKIDGSDDRCEGREAQLLQARAANSVNSGMSDPISDSVATRQNFSEDDVYPLDTSVVDLAAGSSNLINVLVPSPSGLGSHKSQTLLTTSRLSDKSTLKTKQGWTGAMGTFTRMNRAVRRGSSRELPDVYANAVIVFECAVRTYSRRLMMKAWKERWLALDGRHRALLVFSSSDRLRFKLAISLPNADIRSLTDLWTRDNFVFEVLTPTESLRIAVDSAALAQQCIAQIRDLIKAV